MTPRLPPATGRRARIFRAVARRQYGDPIVPSTLVFAHHPRLLNAFALFNRAVEKPDALPARLKLLAVLRAATVVECEFCIDIGSEHARRAGISDEQLLALPRARESGRFSDEELLMLDYAAAMSRTPPEVTDELVAALRRRFGDRGVLELTHMVAWENSRARINAALGLGAGGFSEDRVCAVPEREAALTAA